MSIEIGPEDFNKNLGDNIEAICFLTPEDMKLHKVSLNSERKLCLQQEILIIDIGREEEVLTTYNTLVNSILYLTDLKTEEDITVHYPDWNKYLYLDNCSTLQLKSENYSLKSFVTPWQQPQVLLQEYLQNAYTRIIVSTNPLYGTNQSGFINEMQTINKVLGEDLCILKISGNIFKGFQQAMSIIFNINITDEEIDKVLAEQFPDISIEKGIKSKYWDLVEMFKSF